MLLQVLMADQYHVEHTDKRISRYSWDLDFEYLFNNEYSIFLK